MYVLLCKSDIPLNRKICRLAGIESSHLALQFGEFIVAPYPTMLSPVQIVPLSEYLLTNQVLSKQLMTTDNVRLRALLDQLHGKKLTSTLDRVKLRMPEKWITGSKLNYRGICATRLLENFIGDEFMRARMQESPELLTTDLISKQILPYLRGAY